jgi:hypothetical protein
MPQQCQAIALAEYTLEIQAQLYIDLYRQVLAKVVLIKKWGDRSTPHDLLL